MIVYRIGKGDLIKDMSGEGARLFGGRWNFTGYPVLYTSESIALAILEYIVKTGIAENKLKGLKIAYIEISDNIKINEIAKKSLPDNWNVYPAPQSLKKIGTDWLISQKSLVLKVPAVSAPDSFNILVNPAHHNFNKVKIKHIRDYNPDIRFTENGL